MHFVSAQSQEETLSDITSFIRDNFRDSVASPDSKALNDFEDKISTYESNEDYTGLLEYILSLKNEVATLPTSHKSKQLTVQRMVLLILPLFQKIEEDKSKHATLRKLIEGYSDLIDQSDFPQPVKVNA
jgi:hypothetical protein